MKKDENKGGNLVSFLRGELEKLDVRIKKQESTYKETDSKLCENENELLKNPEKALKYLMSIVHEQRNSIDEIRSKLEPVYIFAESEGKAMDRLMLKFGKRAHKLRSYERGIEERQKLLDDLEKILRS